MIYNRKRSRRTGFKEVDNDDPVPRYASALPNKQDPRTEIKKKEQEKEDQKRI
jgi:hypothetical protein